MITLTREQKELFSYMDILLSKEGHLQYDFTDKKQYAFARMMTTLSGSAEKYSGTLKSLELMKKHHLKYGVPVKVQNLGNTSGWQNMFTIPGLNLTQNGTIASKGMATIVGGYSSMNLTLIVQSKKSKNIVAHGFNNNFAQALLTVNTEPSASKEIDVSSYLHYLYNTSDNPLTSPVSGLVKRDDTRSTT